MMRMLPQSVSMYLGAKPSQSFSPVPASTSATSSSDVFRRSARNSAMRRTPFTNSSGRFASTIMQHLHFFQRDETAADHFVERGQERIYFFLAVHDFDDERQIRSEEHTSELQS